MQILTIILLLVFHISSFDNTDIDFSKIEYRLEYSFFENFELIMKNEVVLKVDTLNWFYVQEVYYNIDTTNETEFNNNYNEMIKCLKKRTITKDKYVQYDIYKKGVCLVSLKQSYESIFSNCLKDNGIDIQRFDLDTNFSNCGDWVHIKDSPFMRLGNILKIE